MTINVHCPKCKSGAKIATKECRRCNHQFTPGNRKYRITVKLSNGKRKSKIVEFIELAKKVEAKLKTDAVEHAVFNIHKIPKFHQFHHFPLRIFDLLILQIQVNLVFSFIYRYIGM